MKCLQLCVILGFAQSGFAQNATLTGKWAHGQDAKEQAQRFEAIDGVTKDIPIKLTQRMVREKLRAKTVPFSALNFNDTGDRVTVSRQNHSVTLKTDGSPVRVKSERGTATLRAKRENGKLVVESRAQNGVQTTVYSLSKDRSRLILDTRITGGNLKNEITFRTTYLRLPK